MYTNFARLNLLEIYAKRTKKIFATLTRNWSTIACLRSWNSKCDYPSFMVIPIKSDSSLVTLDGSLGIAGSTIIVSQIPESGRILGVQPSGNHEMLSCSLFCGIIRAPVSPLPQVHPLSRIVRRSLPSLNQRKRIYRNWNESKRRDGLAKAGRVRGGNGGRNRRDERRRSPATASEGELLLHPPCWNQEENWAKTRTLTLTWPPPLRRGLSEPPLRFWSRASGVATVPNRHRKQFPGPHF